MKVTLRFNADATSNIYTWSFENNSGSDNRLSQDDATLYDAINEAVFGQYYVSNRASSKKMLNGHTTNQSNRRENAVTWNNTSAQITRIQFLGSGTDLIGIGSRLIVEGRD